MMRDKKMERMIAASYTNGVPVADICARFQIGLRTLYDVVDRFGVPRRSLRPQGIKATEEQIRRAVGLYEEGKKLAIITKSTGVSFYTLKRALKRARVPMRGRGGGNGGSVEKHSFGRKPSRRGRRKQTTTNIVMLQKAYGEDFVGLVNGVLRGDLELGVL